MPYEFTFAGKGRIYITYDADGTKLRKDVYDTGNNRISRHDYVNGAEYENNELQFFNAGFVRLIKEKSVDSYRTEYALADHLGNNRVTYSDLNGDGRIDDKTEVVQENHYYPLGMQMEGDWSKKSVTSSPKQNYRFNGSEWTTDFDLAWGDHGARYYLPAIGAWNGIDALAESYASFSPFHFAMNNPIKYSDPSGMGAEDWIQNKSSGLYSWRSDIHGTGDVKDSDPFRYIGKTYQYESTQGWIDLRNDGSWGASEAGAKKFNEDFVRTTKEFEPLLSAAATFAGVTATLLVPGGGAAVATERGALALGNAIKLTPRVAGGAKVVAVAEKATTMELTALNPTHYLTRSQNAMQKLVNDIREFGIKTPIEYITSSGKNYIVGGNHRYFAAMKLGIQEVEVVQRQLPFLGYKTPLDLMLEGNMPGYWRFIK